MLKIKILITGLLLSAGFFSCAQKIEEGKDVILNRNKIPPLIFLNGELKQGTELGSINLSIVELLVHVDSLNFYRHNIDNKNDNEFCQKYLNGFKTSNIVYFLFTKDLVKEVTVDEMKENTKQFPKNLFQYNSSNLTTHPPTDSILKEVETIKMVKKFPLVRWNTEGRDTFKLFVIKCKS